MNKHNIRGLLLTVLLTLSACVPKQEEGKLLTAEVISPCGSQSIQSAEFTTNEALVILCEGSDKSKEILLGEKTVIMPRDFSGGVHVNIDQVTIVTSERQPLFSLKKGERLSMH